MKLTDKPSRRRRNRKAWIEALRSEPLPQLEVLEWQAPEFEDVEGGVIITVDFQNRVILDRRPA